MAGRKDQIVFRFKRTTTGIELVSFRCTAYIEDREVDPDLRGIEHHEVFTSRPDQMSEVNKTLSKKSIAYDLTAESADAFTPYLRGDFSSEYDNKNPGPKAQYLHEAAQKAVDVQTGEPEQQHDEEEDDGEVTHTATMLPRAASVPTTMPTSGAPVYMTQGGYPSSWVNSHQTAPTGAPHMSVPAPWQAGPYFGVPHHSVPAGASAGSVGMPAGQAPLDWVNMFAMQQQNMYTMQQQMMTLVSQMQQTSVSRDNKMIVTKTDGTSEDAKTWMKVFELSCSNNKWHSDKQKIVHLKAAFVPGSAADRWYSSRIIDQEEAPWSEWKESYIQAFSLNRIEAAQAALHWSYRGGKLLDYYYEKERLLKLAFSELPVDVFVTHVMLGLPAHMQNILLGKELKDKVTLVAELNKLVALTKQKGEAPGRSFVPPGANQLQPYHYPSNNASRPRFNSHAKQASPHPQQPQPQADWKPNNQSKDKKPPAYGNKGNASGRSYQTAAVNNAKEDRAKDGEASADKVAACLTPVPLPLHDVNVNGKSLKALLDTGSQRDIVLKRVVEEQGWIMTRKTTNVIAFNSSPAVADWCTEVVVSMHPNSSLSCGHGSDVKSEALVFEELPYDMLIGLPTLQRLGIRLSCSPVIAGVTEQAQRVSGINDIRNMFPDVLKADREPQFVVPFDITDPSKLTGSKPFRIPHEKRQRFREAIEEMLCRGIVRHSTSKTPAPSLAVDKPNGKIRPCFSYQKVNELTILDPFPFPIIDDVITSYGGCKWFTKIDLKDGFHQIALTEETKLYTAFITPWDVYESNRLPFGWKNSPPTFQRIMTRVLGDLLHHRRVHVYVDDICTGAPTREENEHLTFLILQRLDMHGFTINESKSEFNKQSILLLGRVIDGETRTTKMESIEKVRNMARPRDRKGVMQYRGLLGHFRDWIPNYQRLMRPLDKLTRQNVDFEWTPECEASFQKLNELVTSDLVLKQPDWALPFELCCDASHLGTGAVLYQKDAKQEKGKQMRLIAFHSSSFTPAEINFTVTEKECLSVIRAVKYFRSYLDGRSFTVHTDHQALATLLEMKEPKGRLSRWQMFLLAFEMTINHRRGVLLTDADAISRLCVYPEAYHVAFLSAKSSLEAEDKMFLLKRYHDDADSGGHDGILRTYIKLQTRFGDRWPGLRKDVTQYVRSCDICQQAKFKYKPKPDYLVIAPHADSPYHTVHMDYGELKKKSEGCKTTRSFILLVDEFSRSVTTKAMRQTSRGLTLFMEQLPFLPQIKRIVTDNGPSFISTEFNGWCHAKGIKLVHSTPFHPAGNGLAERKIQTVKSFLSCYKSFPGGWKACLDAATRHLNRSYNTVIGCTPNFLAFGKTERLPADVELGIEPQEETPFTAAQIMDKRKKVQAAANKNKRLPDFKEGDEILFRKGDQGKEVFGPAVVSKVVRFDNVPKTLIIGNNERTVAVKDAVPYSRRAGTTFASALMMGLTLMCLANSTSAHFKRESNVVWTKLSVPVVSGFYYVTHVISLNHTCESFISEVPSNYTGTANATQLEEELLNWCHLKLHEVYFAPLRQICRTRVWSYHTSRPKRQTMAVMLGGLAVYTFLSGQNFLSNVMSYFKTDDNAVAIDEAQQQLVMAANRFHTSNGAIHELLSSVSNIAERVNKVEDQSKGFFMLNRDLSRKYTQAAFELNLLGQLIENVVDLWDEKRMPAAFFDRTSALSPVVGLMDSRLDHRHAVPDSCDVLERRGLVTFRYWIPKREERASLYEASPFVLRTLEPTTHSSRVCRVKYSGPAYAIMAGDCVQTLEQSDHPDATRAFLLQGLACEQRDEGEAEAYWRIKECHAAFTPPAQVKLGDGKTFIYCYNRTISYKDSQGGLRTNESCPPFVFSLPNDVRFRIDNFTYEVAQSAGYEAASEYDMDALNHAVYPIAGREPWINIAKLQDWQNIIDHNDLTVSRIGTHRSEFITISLILILTLCFMLTCTACSWFLCSYIKRRSRVMARRRRPRRTLTMDHTDTDAQPEAVELVMTARTPPHD